MVGPDYFIGNRMTIVDKPDPLHHRSKIMIHSLKNPFWVFAEFESEKQMDIFRKQLGFAYELESENKSPECGMLRTYKLSKRLVDADWDGFDIEDLPDEVETIKALSYGRIVDCYISKGVWTILFFRPNPAAHDIYHPLAISQHMKHHEIYGRY